MNLILTIYEGVELEALVDYVSRASQFTSDPYGSQPLTRRSSPL